MVNRPLDEDVSPLFLSDKMTYLSEIRIVGNYK